MLVTRKKRCWAQRSLSHCRWKHRSCKEVKHIAGVRKQRQDAKRSAVTVEPVPLPGSRARCSGYMSIASKGASESAGCCQAHLLLSYLFTVCQNGRVTHSKHQRILHYLRGWLTTWLRLKGRGCPSFCHLQNLWRSHLWALVFLLLHGVFLSPSQMAKFKGL